MLAFVSASPILALSFLAACQATERYPWRPPSALEIHFGFRDLDERTYGPVDDQVVIGVVGAHEPPQWPVGLEFGFHFAEDETDFEDLFSEGDIESRNIEVSLGARHTFGSPWSPTGFIAGAGLAWVRGRFRDRELDLSGSDSDVAPYAHAAFVAFQGPRYFGFDLRALWGASLDLSLAGSDGDYLQATFVFGAIF